MLLPKACLFLCFYPIKGERERERDRERERNLIIFSFDFLLMWPNNSVYFQTKYLTCVSGWGGGEGGVTSLGYKGASQVDLYFVYLMNENTLTHHFFSQ